MSLLLMAPLLSGCGSASDILSSDLLSKDADWFSRSGRVFVKNVSIETPPLTPDKPVAPDDLISADGLCTGWRRRSAQGDPVHPPTTLPLLRQLQPVTVALGHTECDVTRGIGVAPDNESLQQIRGETVLQS